MSENRLQNVAVIDEGIAFERENLLNTPAGVAALDSGDFHETLTTIATGAKITTTGSYIVIYRRQRNGSWLIVQHVFTGTPPHES